MQGYNDSERREVIFRRIIRHQLGLRVPLWLVYGGILVKLRLGLG